MKPRRGGTEEAEQEEEQEPEEWRGRFRRRAGGAAHGLLLLEQRVGLGLPVLCVEGWWMVSVRNKENDTHAHFNRRHTHNNTSHHNQIILMPTPHNHTHRVRDMSKRKAATTSIATADEEGSNACGAPTEVCAHSCDVCDMNESVTSVARRRTNDLTHLGWE